MRRRRESLPPDVLARARLARGERVLAHTQAGDDTWLLGTREALVLVGPAAVRIPWETVATASWDREAELLRVVEVADFGLVPTVHLLTVAEPGTLLALVRERVTASVLLTRRVPVADRRGVTISARRTPHGDGEITWAVELDDGLDPDDPLVQEVASAGIRAATDDLGVEPGDR